MGRYFEENYQLLKQKLDQMTGLVQYVISKTVEALTTHNAELAQQVVEEDEKIDRLEIEIDELVLKLLALQQPMAIDLRFLITALKITNDLERMGDQATNIAQGVIMMSEMEPPPPLDLIDFTKMEAVVLEMVRKSIESFTKGDVEMAREVVRRDDEVDDMNRVIIKRLATHLKRHPENADLCMSLLLITRNLERIGDLSTNIAEDAVYYIEGKIIKHASWGRDQESAD